MSKNPIFQERKKNVSKNPSKKKIFTAIFKNCKKNSKAFFYSQIHCKKNPWKKISKIFSVKSD